MQLVDGHRMLTNDEIYALSTKSDEVEVFVMSLGGISRQSLKGVQEASINRTMEEPQTARSGLESILTLEALTRL